MLFKGRIDRAGYRREKIRTVAIVPAAGSGKRLNSRVKKPFVSLRGKPLVTYALKALESSKAIDAIVVAVEKPCVRRFEGLVNRFRFKKIIRVVVGGRTRFESVRNCIKDIDRSFDIVLIHDGARPFLEDSVIESSIRLAKRWGGCIIAIPENDTVKLADRSLFVKKTLDRKDVFCAQTPQAFRCDLIKRAYGLNKGEGVTDDSALVEGLGEKVKILKGSRRNIKITTKEDLKLAEALLSI